VAVGAGSAGGAYLYLLKPNPPGVVKIEINRENQGSTTTHRLKKESGRRIAQQIHRDRVDRSGGADMKEGVKSSYTLVWNLAGQKERRPWLKKGI